MAGRSESARDEREKEEEEGCEGRIEERERMRERALETDSHQD